MSRFPDSLTRFRADTAEHAMTVLHDDGLYRHLRFARGGSAFYRYDLVTWPGYLTVTGDMGTWAFAREADMFGFFRGGRDINPGYWAEKLQAGASGGSRVAEEYSEDAYRQQVMEHLQDYLAGDCYDLDADTARDLYAAVWEALLDHTGWDYPGGDEETARVALRDFEHRIDRLPVAPPQQRPARTRDRVFRFEDTYEWNLRTHNPHFLWICHAIRHGIAAYDQTQRAAA